MTLDHHQTTFTNYSAGPRKRYHADICATVLYIHSISILGKELAFVGHVHFISKGDLGHKKEQLRTPLYGQITKRFQQQSPKV